MSITGIILAAGQSRRMGQPKPALRVASGESFLERAVRTLRAAGCRRVLVVVNAAAETIADEDVQLVVNEDDQSEQIDSLRLALQQLDENTAAVLVLPVDVPLVDPGTAAAVVTSFRERAAPVVVPVHNSIAGHPVLFARTTFADIVQGTWPEGMRSVLLHYERDMSAVNVHDPGTLIDIDTPEDYRRHVAQP